jgi:hypothetical protein
MAQGQSRGHAPLHLAAYNKEAECVEVRCAGLCTLCALRSSAPRARLAPGGCALVQALIQLGADVNARSAVSPAGWDPGRQLYCPVVLPRCTAHWGRSSQVHCPMQLPGAAHCLQGGVTALIAACLLGQGRGLACCKLLLEAGADPNVQPEVCAWRQGSALFSVLFYPIFFCIALPNLPVLFSPIFPCIVLPKLAVVYWKRGLLMGHVAWGLLVGQAGAA